MERFTVFNLNKTAIGTQYGMIQSVVDDCRIGEVIDRLGVYEDLEEQGLLIKFPCKPGDIVYTIEKNCSPCERCEHGEEVNYNTQTCYIYHKDYECPSPDYYIEDHKVEGFEVSSGGIELVEEWGYDCKHIFEPYYLTREAAETALKESEVTGI